MQVKGMQVKGMQVKGMQVKGMQISGRSIGDGHPVYIIAELSANHGGELGRAKELVAAAVEAGADAVKLQTYTADTLTIDCDEACFRIDSGTVWDGRSLYDLYDEAHMPWAWQPELMATANRAGVDLFSSPFDASAVAFLESMDVPAYKIASFEIVDKALLKCVARTGKPVIVSTGMANENEIGKALETLETHGAGGVTLLKCTSAYPALPANMNLRTLFDMKSRFGVPVGLSDHTLTDEAAVVSVALGASVIEKHITLSRDDGGPDAGFSLEPHEFQRMVTAVRNAEASLGRVQYGPSESDRGNLAFRRSLFVVEDMSRGELFTESNVRSIRPGQGLSPFCLGQVLGHRVSRDVKRGTPLSHELVGDAEI